MKKARIESKTQDFELHRIENPLFSKAKIYVMYHGKNPNGTTISKEAVERNINTIKNIPIVGEFSKENHNFKGHGGALEIGEYGDIEFIHTTSPLGVIPESAKITWEFLKDEKEIEREYLVVDGAYVWNRYEKEVSALKRDNYGQSMEIEIMDGEWSDDENAYDIKDFAFSAFCILGIDRDGVGEVQPAFSNAKIITYNNKDFKDELNEMLKEFKFSLGYEEKGVNSLKFKELLEKHSLTVEELQAKGINPEDFESEEELEAKIQEVLAEDKKEDEEELDAPDEQITVVTMGDGQIENDESVEDKAENPIVKDATGGDTEGAVDGGGTEDATNVDGGTGEDTQVTANTTDAIGGTQVTDANITGSVANDNYSEKVNDLESKLSVAMDEIETLKGQVEEYQKKEHETNANSVIAKFKGNFGLEDEDVKSIDVHEFTIEDLESKLYEVVGRKASVKKEETNNKFSLDLGKISADEPYASLFEKIK